jgi:hypothetical protein
MIGFLGAAMLIAAVTTAPVSGPAPMSESVVRVRLNKLGYSKVQMLRHNGEFWEATVIKNGRPEVIRFNATTGAKVEKPVPVMPRPQVTPS